MPLPPKKADKKQPVQVITLPISNTTVKDCLVWKGQPNGPPEIQDAKPYRSCLVHKNMDGNQNSGQAPPPRISKADTDTGTAGQALRGWPGSVKPPEENMDVDAFMRSYMEPEVEVQVVEPRSGPSKVGKKAAAGQANKRQKIKEPGDVFMGDLMSYKYSNDFVNQRNAEMEREQMKKEEKESVEKEGRMALKNRANIKANKAGQLRAIALAEKVETSPLDLWKMKRFTQGATPHISTTTQRRDGREFSSPGGGYGGGNFSGAGNGGVDYFMGATIEGEDGGYQDRGSGLWVDDGSEVDFHMYEGDWHDME